jgi:type I restriction enzyme S subunit
MTTVLKKSGKKKIPKLRFSGFSGEWEVKKLGEVFQRITRKNSENNKNVLTISAQQGLINQEKFFTKSVSAKDVSGYYFLEKDDFAYNKSYSNGYPMGAIKRLKNYEKGVVSTLYICFKLKDKFNSNDFIEKYFDAGLLNEEISKIAQEGARAHGLLNMSVKDFFEVLKLITPSLPEQQKIADFLSTVDDWIENLKREKEQLEKYKKGMMQQIFSQKIRFKADDGKDFPEWEEKKLGEVCDYRNGGAFENNLVENGQYNLITLNSIDINGKLKHFHKTVGHADWYLEKNDLVMVLSDVAHGNFLGLVDVIPEQNKYVLNQRMGLLRIVTKNLNLNYLRTYINKNQKYFKLHGQGSSQQNLSKGDILKFNVELPSLPEQQKIADFLSSIDTFIEDRAKQIKMAEKWKKGLMQQLFI